MKAAIPRGTALVADASSGIGAIYAHRLISRGYDLLLVARDPARLEPFAGWIRSLAGRSVEVLALDLVQQSDLSRLEERVIRDKSVAMLVNDTGAGAAREPPSGSMGPAEAMIALNLGGPARLAYSAALAFARRGGGTIVNIGPVASPETGRFGGTAGAGRAFLAALSHTLETELRADGVRAQAVLPHASAERLWELAGCAVDRLPREIVLMAEELVDQALEGLDSGDTVTRPAAPPAGGWRFEDAAEAWEAGPARRPASRFA